MTGCYDHFSVMVPLTANWTRVKVPWSDLKRQACAASNPPTPANFQPEKQILAISFQQVDPTKGFDFWIDDVVTRRRQSTRRPTSAATLTQAIYNEMFRAPVTPYTYAGFIFGGERPRRGHRQEPEPARQQARSGRLSRPDRARDRIAAARRARSAMFTCSMNLATNCTGTEPRGPARRATCGTDAGPFSSPARPTTGRRKPPVCWHRRDPRFVATNVDFAFGTAAWFWTTTQSAVGICHTAILGNNFGQTTRIINGIEVRAARCQDFARRALQAVLRGARHQRERHAPLLSWLARRWPILPRFAQNFGPRCAFGASLGARDEPVLAYKITNWVAAPGPREAHVVVTPEMREVSRRRERDRVRRICRALGEQGNAARLSRDLRGDARARISAGARADRGGARHLRGPGHARPQRITPPNARRIFFQLAGASRAVSPGRLPR